MAQPCAHCGSTEGPDHLCPAASLNLVGQVLDGRYHIDDVLGHGGMGMVFRATQTSVQRPVAVKTLHPALAAAPQFFERFRREAELASRLRHPNIITIFDFGRTKDGTCYYVMELIEGESLKQVVKRDGPMQLGRAIDLIEQAARALIHAHEQGVIHRDIKPHNMMVQRMDGREFLKVLDFGLVKALEQEEEHQLTSTGQVLGTPQYMPPEQAGGELVDQRSDLYSLAGVLYYCLTGSSPFGANTVRKALQASLTQTVPPVAKKRRGAPVPLALDEFFRKALAREKEDRYQSAEEFIEEMRAAVDGMSLEDLEARPLPGDPNAPGREGSGSSASRRSPRGTVASRAKPRGSNPSGVVVDPAAIVRPGSRSGQGSAPRSSGTGSKSGVRARPVEPARSGGGAKTAVFVAIPIVLIGAAVAWWVAVGSSGDAAPVAPVVVATAEPVEPPAPEVIPVAAARSADVSVHIESEPAGAAIYDGEVQIGTTPTELRFPRQSMQTLTLRLGGHEPVEKTLDFSRLASDSTTVKVALKRSEAPRAPTRPAPAPRQKVVDEDPIPVFE